MKNRLFISFLIVAFFNYINGCSVTKTIRITPDNLKLDHEVIKEIILVDLGVIKLNNNGAQYTKPKKYIVGKLKDGGDVKIPVDQIKEFRISH